MDLDRERILGSCFGRLFGGRPLLGFPGRSFVASDKIGIDVVP